MILEHYRNPMNLNHEIKIVITDKEYVEAFMKMDRMDRYALQEFGREDASIEETLMGLQIYARKIEENDE